MKQRQATLVHWEELALRQVTVCCSQFNARYQSGTSFRSWPGLASGLG